MAQAWNMRLRSIGPPSSSTITFNFGTKAANSTHFLSLPNNVPASLVIPIQATATERLNIVKAGLNYRFDWWSTPLVAR